MPDKPSCACTFCRACCHHKPGMMLPEDVGRLAKQLGLTEKELFDKHLAVDVVHDQDRDTYVLAPASVQTKNAGQVYRHDEGGRCVFLQRDGRCGIHAVKPYECRVVDHTTVFDRVLQSQMARPWREQQPMVESLLGQTMPERAVNGLLDYNEERRNPASPLEAQHPLFGVTDLDIEKAWTRRKRKPSRKVARET